MIMYLQLYCPYRLSLFITYVCCFIVTILNARDDGGVRVVNVNNVVSGKVIIGVVEHCWWCYW